MSLNTVFSKRPLIIGEVLFDCFEDSRVLGGAPFNVAWNLKGLGLDPLMVTAVGRDELGAEVVGLMEDWNLDPSGLEILENYPTGRVDIEIDSGQPSYTFWQNVAFDHISSAFLPVKMEQFGLLYHGSLALRTEMSRTTIGQLRKRASCPVFIDINIREPYFEQRVFEPFLADADHLKLNDEELVQMLGASDLHGQVESNESAQVDGLWKLREEMSRTLMKRFGIRNLWLTAGKAGAAWFGPQDQSLQVPAPKVAHLKDTVGAGDAFAAVVLRSILVGQPAYQALSSAVEFAAQVCTLRGAITREKSFYNLPVKAQQN